MTDAGRNSGPRVNFKEVMPHHIEAVLVQADNGLKTLKQTGRYLEKVVSCIDSGQDAVKETKSIKAKYAKVPLRDEMAHFVTACAAAEEVMLHTWNTQQAFKRDVSTSIVKPFLEFYETRQKKRRDMEKDMAKMTSALNSAVADLNKERIQCQKAWDELRAAKEAKETEEISETRGKDIYTKLVTKWKSAKDNAIKRFNVFQKHLATTNQMQANLHTKEIPTRLALLEQFESDRLKLIADCLGKFQVLFATTVVELKQSSDLLAKVVPSLDPSKELAFLIDKWSSYYGTPPQPLYLDHRADLPCTADDLANDVLHNAQTRAPQQQQQQPPPQQQQSRQPANQALAPIPQGNSAMPQNYVVSPTGQIVVPFPPNTPAPASTGTNNSAPRDAPPLMSQSSYNNNNKSSYTQQPSSSQVTRAAETRASIFKQDANFFTSQQQHQEPPAETQTEEVKASEVAVALGTARATYDFGLANDPTNEIQYLHFKCGDLITVYDQGDEWWFGQLGDDAGFFPSNHVMMIT